MSKSGSKDSSHFTIRENTEARIIAAIAQPPLPRPARIGNPTRLIVLDSMA
jgi:hypothetical protein